MLTLNKLRKCSNVDNQNLTLNKLQKCSRIYEHNSTLFLCDIKQTSQMFNEFMNITQLCSNIDIKQASHMFTY